MSNAGLFYQCCAAMILDPKKKKESQSKTLINPDRRNTREREKILRATRGWIAGVKGAVSGFGGL
jgi:hypothetical protein